MPTWRISRAPTLPASPLSTRPSPSFTPTSPTWSQPANGSAPVWETGCGGHWSWILRRGIDDGTFRGDITADELGFLFGSLLETGARMAAEHQAGAEKAAALVTSVFLYGTERRKEDELTSPA